MKGFIAAAVAMAPGFAALPLRRPLHFAFTYDEETGCFGARALLDVLATSGPRPAVAIVGEPTRMSLVEGHKGCCEYRTVFKGLDAHSSMPQQGVSAIEYAVRFAARLLELQEDVKKAVSTDSRFEPPYTTMQIGRIQGGIAQNVIAKDCWIDWEIRPIRRSDAEHVKGAIQDYVQTVLKPAMRKGFEAADIETETICEVEVLEVVEGSAAKQLVAGLTGRSEADVVAFASEAGLFQSAGISSIVCGPGSIRQAHKADEFVSLGQLDACLAMLDWLKAHLVRTAHDRGDAGSA
jgi:acetylornithine deacetylase